NIPEDMRITANTERWTTIWVAKEPKTHKFLLKKYHAVGEKSWPFGGYTLWDTKAEQDYHCYFDCAVIHPENFKRQKKKTAKKKASRIVKKTTKKTAKKKVSRK
ncbi:MAG: hypothetical protein ACXAAH_17040, partial [Promethearchaeota archaeon]